MQPFDRREFLNRSTTAGLTLAAGTMLHSTQSLSAAEGEAGRKSGNQGASKSGSPKVAAFTKSFQDRSIPEVCSIFNEIGLDGLDLTVRPDGHIEPKDVEKELPRAVAAAREAGTEISFLTTAITDDDDDARRILATAGEQGIDRIKLGYYRYRKFGQLMEEMAQVRRQLKKVARLAEKHNVLPCVHVHSGPYIPSHGTMLYELIRDFDPKEVGAYADTSHMVKEGGRDGWRQGFDLLAPWLALVAIKNFSWERGKRDKTGQLRWHTLNVPLADGVAPLPEIMDVLKKLDYRGIYSLHCEYKGGHSFKRLDTEGCIRQATEDFAFFQKLL